MEHARSAKRLTKLVHCPSLLKFTIHVIEEYSVESELSLQNVGKMFENSSCFHH
jgi:hypothetical protein